MLFAFVLPQNAAASRVWCQTGFADALSSPERFHNPMTGKQGRTIVRVETILNSESGSYNRELGETVEETIKDLFCPEFDPNAVMKDVLDAAPRVFHTPAGSFHDKLHERMQAVREQEEADPELKKQPKLMIIGGGDGSLRDAAPVLAENGWIMGVLPMGTINLLARDLGLPLNPVEAVHCLAAGEDRPTDLGEINGKAFISHIAVGVHAWVVRHRHLQERSYHRGRFYAMARAWLRAFRHARPVKMLLRLDDETRKVRSPLLLISNNRFGADSRFFPLRSRLDGGELAVYLVEAETRLRFALMAAAAMSGRWNDNPLMQAFTVQEAQIGAQGETIRVSIDGDVHRMSLPLNIRILPGALTMRIPGEP